VITVGDLVDWVNGGNFFWAFSQLAQKMGGGGPMGAIMGRMGARLSGRRISQVRGHDIISDGIALGSIQVPGGSEPIVLHRDAVSGGGYFMVGTVISADMDLIGQLQPHTPAKFMKVDMDVALQARHDREALLQKLRAALN